MQGQHIVKVGKKYRIAFPSEYLKLLGKAVILTYGLDESLIATSEENLDLITKNIEDQSFLIAKVRELRRVFLGGKTDVEFDSQNRFVLPEYLREYAHVEEETEVTFVLQRENGKAYIEIWKKEKWDADQKERLKQLGTLAESFSMKEVNE